MSIVERIVEENLSVYRASPVRLQEDVTTEAQVATDYRGRLVFELLQNADDAMQDGSHAGDAVHFLVTDDELWMANTGRALTDADIQGLCGVGASSKLGTGQRRRASIGHKGVGFKSVLEITETPRAFSETCAFELGERHARPHVGRLWQELYGEDPRNVPAMRFPAAISTTPRWDELSAFGHRTAFCFPFRAAMGAAHRRAVADRLLGLSLTTVLFLKHLDQVDVAVDQGGALRRRRWTIRRQRLVEGTWRDVPGLTESGLYHVEVSSDDGAGDVESAGYLVAHDAEVEIGDHRGGLSGPAWDGVELSEVSVGLFESEDGSATLPGEHRRFHVFLPTQERSTYPMLVNGAFVTDLSRQQVRIGEGADDYNSHLIGRAARLFRERLLPELLRRGPAAVLAALDRAGVIEVAGPAALLHRRISDELREVPLLPDESGELLRLGDVVLPSRDLGPAGADFRSVLVADAGWEGRRFPAAVHCVGDVARVAADHGAEQLQASECLTVLGALADVDRSKLQEHESGRFEVDPVLELCTRLWSSADAADRSALERRARQEPLFPVQRHADGTVRRVVLGEGTAFFPPRAAQEDLPLEGLQFMAHALCWGTLLPRERGTFLDDRLRTWAALFEVKEFKFEEVMRAAVLPGLALNPEGPAREMLGRLHDLQALAVVCQLAGALTKPDRPLPYARLSGDRPLVNLARLPVPVRVADDESPRWLPAWRVYFGRDWIGDESVEVLADVVEGTTGQPLAVEYLAPPETLLGRLEGFTITTDDEPVVDDDGQVSEDEDTDRAVETTEQERWVSFLRWLGVSGPLRLVHFHDVDDNIGWTRTKGLSRPDGWAFRTLGDVWTRYETELRDQLSSAQLAAYDPYLYDVHDLDHLGELIALAEEDGTGAIGGALFTHLARNWRVLGPEADAEVALITAGSSPSRREPARAKPEEIHVVGDNLWVHRLRHAGTCPTTHGPRRGDTAWRRTPEVDRIFGRRQQDPAKLLPLLAVDDDISASGVKALAERYGVRSDLSPSTFTVQDARGLCERLAELYDDVELTTSLLSRVLRPAYRELFGLLSGRHGQPDLQGSLRDAPLLTVGPDGHRFLPAREVLYASTPGTAERAGVNRTLAMFVLEAEPSATAPLRSLFGVRLLEDALQWHPDPSEPLEGADLEAFRQGINGLVPVLLARLRAERPEDRESDRAAVQAFAARVEPVAALGLRCTLDDHELSGLPDRKYFVRGRRDGLQAFVVWSGQPWPPQGEDAQTLAMALADSLGVNLVETFLAFIEGDEDRRRRLLDIAGAVGHLDEVTIELAGDDLEPPGDEEAPRTTPAPAEQRAHGGDVPPVPPTSGLPAAAPIPLLDLADLVLDGEPLLVAGSSPSDVPKGGGTGAGSGGGAGRRAAPATDLGALDALGMGITLAAERQRLARGGAGDPKVIVDDVATVGEDLVVAVHSPAAIAAAQRASDVVRRVFDHLQSLGVSRLHPGFDVLTIRDGEADRLIELKSSGVDARVQEMSWNEWKSASHHELRQRFWLYLAGNLRADLAQPPFLRAIRDPFGTLLGDEQEHTQRRRVVQLRVREFSEAEQLDISVRRASGEPS